jgi:hypothetical protein
VELNDSEALSAIKMPLYAAGPDLDTQERGIRRDRSQKMAIA